jgi:hypothetical protein
LRFVLYGLRPSAEASTPHAKNRACRGHRPWVRLGDLGWNWVDIGEGRGVAKIAKIAGIAKDRRNLKGKDLNGISARVSDKKRHGKAPKMCEIGNGHPRIRQRAVRDRRHRKCNSSPRRRGGKTKIETNRVPEPQNFSAQPRATAVQGSKRNGTGRSACATKDQGPRSEHRQACCAKIQVE